MGPIGASHTVEHGLALLIHQPCEELLRVSEDQGPGEDLCRRIQSGKARNKLASHKKQPK